MFVKVHRPVNTPKVCDNKGSCEALVRYLSKENDEERDYYDSFFSHQKDYVSPQLVKKSIDNNHKTLKAKDDKFYMLSINPSQKELRHMVRKITGKEVAAFDDLSKDEKEKVLAEIKVYARKCMDRYAQNFRRKKIASGEDIVYFGRVETERHYSGTDKEVKEGLAKEGDLKPGLQLHVHIVVSRMDKTQTVSLSPLAKSKGSVNIINGKKVMVGFQRTEWAALCADDFYEMYDYHPQYKEGENTGTYIPGQNQMMSMAKDAILQNEFRTERAMLSLSIRMIRFIYKPSLRKAFSMVSSTGNQLTK